MQDNVFAKTRSQSEALKSSEKYKANLRTFMSKYDEIKSEHRGEFIAIFDVGDIIGDTSHEALLEKIRQKVEDKYGFCISNLHIKN